MRLTKLFSLCILAFSLIAPAFWGAGQQKPKPDKPLEEWQQSWSKFDEHIDQSRKVSVRPEMPIYLVTPTHAKIIDIGQTPTSAPLAPKPGASQDRSTASSDDWKRDPTAFVRLLIGDDLSPRSSAAGTPSVSVPDALRQQIIGTRVMWTVTKRASPFPSGPRTLSTAAITHGNRVTGVLLLMPRRAAGDTEVCEVPYQNIPIDAPVEISGKIASFQAGIRPDGQIVVVVEVTDVAGCQTEAAAPSVDISGRWDYKRSSAPNIKSDKGTIDLTRDASCDQDGFTCYTYTQPAIGQSDKSQQRKWTIALKGSQVIICIVNCAFSCFGALTPEGKIEAPCKFLDMFAGEFKAQRAK